MLKKYIYIANCVLVLWVSHVRVSLKRKNKATVTLCGHPWRQVLEKTCSNMYSMIGCKHCFLQVFVRSNCFYFLLGTRTMWTTYDVPSDTQTWQCPTPHLDVFPTETCMKKGKFPWQPWISLAEARPGTAPGTVMSQQLWGYTNQPTKKTWFLLKGISWPWLNK